MLESRQEVANEATRDSNNTPSRNELINEIRKELAANSEIKLKWFEKNPAHTLLNRYLADKRKELDTHRKSDTKF